MTKKKVAHGWKKVKIKRRRVKKAIKKKRKVKKAVKKKKRISPKRIPLETKRRIEIPLKLPRSIERKDIRFYSLHRKLIVAKKDWKHIKKIILPFSPDKNVEMRKKKGKLMLKIRER